VCMCNNKDILAGQQRLHTRKTLKINTITLFPHSSAVFPVLFNKTSPFQQHLVSWSFSSCDLIKMNDLLTVNFVSFYI
jgi:hypothetical protein